MCFSQSYAYAVQAAANRSSSYIRKRCNFYQISTGFPINNIADLARLAIVYKSGGFYSDMDVFNFQSVEKLRNFITLEVNPSYVDTSMKIHIQEKINNLFRQHHNFTSVTAIRQLLYVNFNNVLNFIQVSHIVTPKFISHMAYPGLFWSGDRGWGQPFSWESGYSTFQPDSRFVTRRGTSP